MDLMVYLNWNQNYLTRQLLNLVNQHAEASRLSEHIFFLELYLVQLRFFTSFIKVSRCSIADRFGGLFKLEPKLIDESTG